MAALSGKLSDFEMKTILQFIKTSGKNGVLKISSSSCTGEIHFKDQSIVSAHDQEDNTGEVALFNLFRLKEGEFSFNPTDTVNKEAIDIPIDQAHSSLQEKLKEWEEITKEIPDLNLFVSLIADPEVKEVKINPEQWIIAAQVNDERTVRELSKVTSMSLLETAKIVYSLIVSGLAEVHEGFEEEEEEDVEEQPPENNESGDQPATVTASKAKRTTRKKKKKGFFRR
ncbi:MAG: DUF4388 domain-containing protein [bacterium]